MTRPDTLLPNARTSVTPDDVRWIIGVALEVSPKLSHSDPKRYQRVRERILSGRFSADAALQLFDLLLSTACAQYEGDFDAPAPGYTLRIKPVTKRAVAIAAGLAAEACVTLLVEFPAPRREDPETPLKIFAERAFLRH